MYKLSGLLAQSMKVVAESLNPILASPAAKVQIRTLCTELLDGAISREAFLEGSARLTNRSIGCSRTGIWLFVDEADGRLLRCVAMYDAVADRMTKAPDERREVQPYFDALETREGS